MPAPLKFNVRALAAVDDLALVAHTIVEGFFDGLHRSPFLGYSTEFSAYRPYTQGDNPRYIDWKVWGRTDKLYVKQFEQYTNLRGEIFLDTSASMDFGEGEANKFDYGRVLAAALAYLMARQNDAPGLVLFNEQAVRSVPARANRLTADEIFQVLSRINASGRTSFEPTFHNELEAMHRKGMAVLISDFFTTEETTLEVLRKLHIQRQEVIVFHLLAPQELDLNYAGEILFEDAETGQQLPVMPDVVRKQYQLRLGALCDRIRQECLKLEMDYQQLRTDQPLDYALVAYLERRAAVQG